MLKKLPKQRRKPGSFYILKTYLAPTVPLHTCIEIQYSNDYGQTYTVYYHDLDSTYTSVPEIPKTDNAIQIFPNPVSAKLTVDLHENDSEATIYLLELTGRLQLTTRMPAGQRKAIIDVSTLPAGIYLLKVMEGVKVIGVEEVVVE